MHATCVPVHGNGPTLHTCVYLSLCSPQGGSSKSFAHIKRMAFSTPEVLHALLDKLADNITDYCRYQV